MLGLDLLFPTGVLILAVLLVNGWTDAPNAIATAVATGALPFRRAVLLAAACNLAGVLWAYAFHSAVTDTIYSLFRFDGPSPQARAALCAALCAIVLWAVLAWRFGVPTSESHALAAGLTGAALALPGGLSNVSSGAWYKLLLGLVLSLGLGIPAGKVVLNLLSRLALPKGLCCLGLRISAALNAFLHGAQDGQKFLGILLLCVFWVQGAPPSNDSSIISWAPALLCGATMALGTGLGGRRIIDTVGRDMVPLTPRAGLAADLGCGTCLLLCTLAGLPVSTTHVKTAAILGAGRAASGEANYRVIWRILLTWLFTFPGCGLLGFFLTRIFLLPD